VQMSDEAKKGPRIEIPRPQVRARPLSPRLVDHLHIETSDRMGVTRFDIFSGDGGRLGSADNAAGAPRENVGQKHEAHGDNARGFLVRRGVRVPLSAPSTPTSASWFAPTSGLDLKQW
jgi:hypothetical protein